MGLGTGSFTGWSGWPLGDHDDLHDYSICIQLWLALYERCVMLGGTNDSPHVRFITVGGVDIPVDDDLPWLDDKDTHATVMPQLGDDAHAAWTGGRTTAHLSTGGDGDYPGAVIPDYWFVEDPDGPNRRKAWVAGAWKCYRCLQEWLVDNCTGFVAWKPKADGSVMGINGYDDWTATDPSTGLPTHAIRPPNYTLETWSAKGSIPNMDGNYFPRLYPAEFRHKTPITVTQIDCDGEETVVEVPADTYYTDGVTPIAAGDLARWVGRNAEDDDTGTGMFCYVGDVPSWVPWLTSWVKADGKVYRRNDSNTAWEGPVEHPYGAVPRQIEAFGFIQRGDYLTPALLNAIFRGIDILRWTFGSASFVNYPSDAANDGTGESNEHLAGGFGFYDPDYFAWSDLQDQTNTRWDTNEDQVDDATVLMPRSTSNANWNGDGTFGAHLEAAYYYGLASGIPHGPEGGYRLGCDVDFMNWASIGTNNGGGWGDVGTSQTFLPEDDPTHPGGLESEYTVAFDDNGQEVYFRKWRVWDTVSGTDPTRYAEKLGTNDKPDWCPSPRIRDPIETFAAGSQLKGYGVEDVITIRRWDNYAAFAMPLSFWGGGE